MKSQKDHCEKPAQLQGYISEKIMAIVFEGILISGFSKSLIALWSMIYIWVVISLCHKSIPWYLAETI